MEGVDGVALVWTRPRATIGIAGRVTRLVKSPKHQEIPSPFFLAAAPSGGKTSRQEYVSLLTCSLGVGHSSIFG